MKIFGAVPAIISFFALNSFGVLAGALEQTNQNLQVLFEDGNYAEIGWARVWTDVDGVDLTKTETSQVAPDYEMGYLGFKYDFNDSLSAAFVVDQPWGISVFYPEDSPVYAGTEAKVNSLAITGLLKRRLAKNWSIFAGYRAQRFEANASLSGLSADVLDGYTIELAKDYGDGFVAGGAFEIPEIALRLSLTYSSEIKHNNRVTEFLPSGAGGPVVQNSTISFMTPQSVNFEFQTGVSESTLAFAMVRWVDWSEFNISPGAFTALTGEPIASYPKDIFTYMAGVAHQATESLVLAANVSYEDEKNRFGSALGPVNGYTSFGAGAIYSISALRFSIGVAYYSLRDAEPLSGDTVTGSFENNSLIAGEIKLGYSF